ncbi:hypothetical protein SDC9_91927 [bioreactor metagenome]|uniref:Uncharacterized protein n=1 Tax=bioreactor metagenome TaxID=1076179 RepID=A0A644ZZ68_9ZZZZ
MSHILNGLPIPVQIAFLFITSGISCYYTFRIKKRSNKMLTIFSALLFIASGFMALAKTIQTYTQYILAGKILISVAYVFSGVLFLSVVTAIFIYAFKKDINPEIRRVLLICSIGIVLCILVLLSIIIWSKHTA